MYFYNYAVNNPKTPPIEKCSLNGDKLAIYEADEEVSHIALETLKASELLESYGAKATHRLLNQSLDERKYTYDYRAPLLAASFCITALLIIPFLLMMSAFAHDSPRNDCLVTPPERALAWYTGLLFESLGALSAEEGYEANNQELLEDLGAGLRNLSKISSALCGSKEYQGLLLDPAYIAHQSALSVTLIPN